MYEYRVKKVTGVVDGDTIDVELDLGFNISYSQRVRLAGIDTPESRTADKAEKAYDDLMDLGMNVEARYGARMFEVAASMMTQAIAAKSAKIDKKLKMVDLQLKKLAIDKKHGQGDGNTVEGEGYIITDRNSIIEKLKNLNK